VVDVPFLISSYGLTANAADPIITIKDEAGIDRLNKCASFTRAPIVFRSPMQLAHALRVSGAPFLQQDPLSNAMTFSPPLLSGPGAFGILGLPLPLLPAMLGQNKLWILRFPTLSHRIDFQQNFFTMRHVIAVLRRALLLSTFDAQRTILFGSTGFAVRVQAIGMPPAQPEHGKRLLG
jgi:hypothetical protein